MKFFKIFVVVLLSVVVLWVICISLFASNKGFVNGCIEWAFEGGHLPPQDHICTYAKDDTTLHVVSEAGVDYEMMMSRGWRLYVPVVTLVGGAGNTVPVYSIYDGRFIVVGNIVHVNLRLSGDGGDEGSGTGVIHVSLPVAAGGDKIDGDLLFFVGTAINSMGPKTLIGSIGLSATTIVLMQQLATNSFSDMIGNDQNNVNRSIGLKFWYKID